METKQIKSYIGHKLVEIADFKAVESEDGVLKISGYANTKYVADRYGDIPTPYNRSYVYDITDFLKNPIMLLGHNSEIKSVAGSFTVCREDEKGLYVEAEFTKSDAFPIMEHARTLIKEGHLRTFSIGGRFLYENPDNISQLTLAKIYEISIVAVPADPNATFKPIGDGKSAKKAEEKAQVVEEVKADYTPLKKKLTLFEIKQKLNKARKNIGQGAK